MGVGVEIRANSARGFDGLSTAGCCRHSRNCGSRVGVTLDDHVGGGPSGTQVTRQSFTYRVSRIAWTPYADAMKRYTEAQ
jgi:hypothetical protein